MSLAGGGACGIQMGEKYDSQISPTSIFPEATSGAVQHPPTPMPQQARENISCLADFCKWNPVHFCICLRLIVLNVNY